MTALVVLAWLSGLSFGVWAAVRACVRLQEEAHETSDEGAGLWPYGDEPTPSERMEDR